MRDEILRLIGLGITMSELLLYAEEKGISNRRVFVIVRELLQEGEIFKVDKQDRTGEVFVMPRNIQYPITDEDAEYEGLTIVEW